MVRRALRFFIFGGEEGPDWTEEGFAVKPNSIRYGENWSGGRPRNSSPEMNSEGMGESVDAYG